MLGKNMSAFEHLYSQYINWTCT